MIEELIQKLNANLEANTKALLAVLDASGSPTREKTAEEPAKKTRNAKKAAPEPTPEPEEPAAEDLTPTKVDAPAKSDDTPSVPANQEPGQPPASEHVDEDEVIGQISNLVNNALQNADDVEAKKEEWTAIRKTYGVDRISELKGQPAKLLEVLAKAKAFGK